MKIDFVDCVFAVYMVIVLILVCCGAYLVLSGDGDDNIRKQAIERGHAEYVVDSDGKTTWQWKEKQ